MFRCSVICILLFSLSAQGFMSDLDWMTRDNLVQLFKKENISITENSVQQLKLVEKLAGAECDLEVSARVLYVENGQSVSDVCYVCFEAQKTPEGRIKSVEDTDSYCLE